MEILDYYHDKIPVLGVCLGHQAIGEYFGAKVIKCAMPVHGKVFPVRQLRPHPVFEGIPHTFNVTRYHSLELGPLPNCLKPLWKPVKGI
ncbi:glutamine amidotransferase-related protein [Echinicola jeungdonensis]|uniref:glutamine amidotransferase-related protein n=1 Tax=Echinicola jeungdonensis TaxID=709343 RepID=UPI00338E0467